MLGGAGFLSLSVLRDGTQKEGVVSVNVDRSMVWNLQCRGREYSQEGFCIMKLTVCEESSSNNMCSVKVSTD